jgi:phosphoglycerate dehydrogenase-like enzyme
VNTALGKEVDEEALIEELKTGRFYACIDQTLKQPAPLEHPFRKMKNVMLTPHIAGHVSNGFKRQGRYIVEDIERFYKGEKLSHQLNLEMLKIIA